MASKLELGFVMNITTANPREDATPVDQINWAKGVMQGCETASRILATWRKEAKTMLEWSPQTRESNLGALAALNLLSGAIRDIVPLVDKEIDKWLQKQQDDASQLKLGGIVGDKG